MIVMFFFLNSLKLYLRPPWARITSPQISQSLNLTIQFPQKKNIRTFLVLQGLTATRVRTLQYITVHYTFTHHITPLRIA